MISQEELEVIKELLSDTVMPIGTIITFAAPNAPEGFLLCDGSLVEKSKYPKLYKVIGNIYGEKEDMFRLPDLRGRFVRGFDSANLLDSDRKFGDYQEDAFQGHSHTTNWGKPQTMESGEHFHYIYANYWDSPHTYSTKEYVHENRDFDNDYKKKTSIDGKHTHTLPDIILGEVCSSKYGRAKFATETRPHNIALNFCIKAK